MLTCLWFSHWFVRHFAPMEFHLCTTKIAKNIISKKNTSIKHTNLDCWFGAATVDAFKWKIFTDQHFNLAWQYFCELRQCCKFADSYWICGLHWMTPAITISRCDTKMILCASLQIEYVEAIDGRNAKLFPLSSTFWTIDIWYKYCMEIGKYSIILFYLNVKYWMKIH